MTFATKIYITIILIIISGLIVFAQDSFDDQFRFAEKLYNDEKYFDTITELKRLLFFDQDGKYNYKANNLIGQCYKQGGKFTDAIRYFTLAEINSKNVDEIYNAKIDIVRVNILRRTTHQAFKILDSLESDSRFKDKIDDINYWRGWTFIFADDWENAAVAFAKIDPDHPLKNLAEKVDEDHYSVGFAKAISYIVPGAGQFYTGEYVSGFLSLGWNVLWGYLAVKAFVAERIFDGVMISNFLFLRFYRGNLQNAENFTLEKNIEISNKALHYLQYEYDGLKP